MLDQDFTLVTRAQVTSYLVLMMLIYKTVKSLGIANDMDEKSLAITILDEIVKAFTSDDVTPKEVAND
jgi:hypothetical protein